MHDDGMEVFLNGTQVFRAGGWNGGYEDALSPEAAGSQAGTLLSLP